MQHTAEIKNVLAALMRFQSKIITIKRDAVNSHFKNRYVTLETVMEQTRAILQDCGLLITQMPATFDGKSLMVETVLAHAASGEYIHSAFVVPLAKLDPQGAGSAVTYAMRYAQMAILGIAPSDDDDGNIASQRDEFVQRTQEMFPGAQVVDPTGKGNKRAAGLSLEEQPFFKLMSADAANAKTIHDVDRQGKAWMDKGRKEQWRSEWVEKARAMFIDRRVALREMVEAQNFDPDTGEELEPGSVEAD